MDAAKRLAKTLSILWVDKCSVTAQEEYIQENGASGFRDKIILKDEPCKLSFYNSKAENAPATVDGAGAPLYQRVKLIISADAEIPQGSRVEVTRDGKKLYFKASGQPARYFSHQEILLEVMEEWA